MNIVLFITVLVVSFIVVRIGAIAFQLTGLEWSLAKFQALSCFTATGFTTREAELITATPQRRRIASTLIVLGHAGLVTMIATFANSLRPPLAKLPFLSDSLSFNLLPWINLTIIAIAIYLVYRIFTNSRFARRLTDALRKRMVKKESIKSVSFEELAVATGGYGVSKVAVGNACAILNKTLSDAQLRRHDINILAIVRNEQTIPNPSADMRIITGDELICFGKLENIRKQLCLA